MRNFIVFLVIVVLFLITTSCCPKNTCVVLDTQGHKIGNTKEINPEKVKKAIYYLVKKLIPSSLPTA
jgi:hypothetical protein